MSFFHGLGVTVSEAVSVESREVQIGPWNCVEYIPDIIGIGKMVFVKNEIAYIATDYNHDNFIMYENKKIGVEYDISNIDTAKTSSGNRLFFIGEWKGFSRVFFYGDYFGNPADRKKYFSEKIISSLYTETDPPYFTRLYFDGKQIEIEYRDITSKPIFSYDESKMALSVEDYNGIEKVVLCNL